jgi:dihydrofolate reductase
MRKIILGLAVSLDGFIEGPNGEYDWCFTDQDYGMTDFFKRIDSIFMGRRSYELVQKMHGGQEPANNPYAHIQSYVFSNTLKKADDKTILIGGDIKKQVNEMKKKQGKDIWLFGGANLTASFMNEGLVDELGLAVHPIILGAGKPLFQGIDKRIELILTDTKTYSSGLVSLNYSVNHK